MSIKQLTLILPLTSLLMLSACASKLSTETPETINLNGTWVLNEQYSQEVVIQRQRNNNRGGRPEGGRGGGRGGPPNGGGERGNRTPQSSIENAVGPGKTPAMTSKEMTITLNNDSMGIAYLNHRYRDVDWGETTFWNSTVNAGWDKDNALVIETKGQHSDMSEHYQLDSKGQVLVLIIDTNGNDRGGEFQRVFTRKTEESKQ